MQVMVMIKATPTSEAGILPPNQAREAMDRFNEELLKANIRSMAAGLRPSAEGIRIVHDGDASSIVDGPFPMTDGLLAGFWIWEVDDMREAVDWATRCPNPMEGAFEIELRPLFEAGSSFRS